MPFLDLILLLLLGYLPVRLGLAAHLQRFPVLERVALSYFLSLVLFFLAGLASFYTRGPALLIHAAPLAGLLAWGLLVPPARGGRSAWRGLPAAEVRALLIVIGAAAWMLVVQATVVNYGGGSWSGDWFEHYERALFFDGQRGMDHRFLDRYELTARPPFFNVVAYVYMSLIGFRFSDYQVAATALGILVLLPAALLLRRLAGRGPEDDQGRGEDGVRSLLLASAFLLLHPMVVTNLIYPWTRMLAGALLLMAWYLYLEAVFSGRPGMLAPCLLLLSAAHLTHYSADVVILPLGAHLAWTAVRRSPRLRRPALAACVLAAALGASWYSWSIATFGAAGTLATNATWRMIRLRAPDIVAGQIAANLKTTLIPFVLPKDPAHVQQADPSLRLYALHDHLHMYWTSTLVGAVSAPALLMLLVLLAARVLPRIAEPRFNLAVAAAAFLLSFLIVPGLEESGIVHLSLQPVCILIFLMLLGAVQRAPGWAAACFSALYAAEAFLFYLLETLERVNPSPARHSALYTRAYYENLRLKLVTHQVGFLSDEHPGLSAASRYLVVCLVPALSLAAWWLLAAATAARTRIRAGPARRPRGA